MLGQKNILITGGTGALGSAFVRKAVQAGASVFFTYHESESKAKELTALGAQGFRLDLSNPEEINLFQKDFRSRIKILHVLIHNAAATSDATVQKMEEAAWDSVLNVNLKAPYLLTKKLLSPLFKANPAKIFFIISRAANQGLFGAANYAASKAGLVGLSKSLAQELGRKNILVNCINPGFMKSRMTQSLPEALIQKNLRESVLEKISSPDEVADFLVYLSSDRMSQASGQTFHYESRKI